MAKLHLQLLGSPKVSWENGSPPRFRSQRTVALFGYLVAEGRPLTREFLAALFWPDVDPAKGKANLRRELHNLARILPGCWQTSRADVVFVPSEGATLVDIYKIQQHEAAQQWLEAAELIGGVFLEGIVLIENLEFETWLLGEQERWRQKAEFILNQTVQQLQSQGLFRQALSYARRLLQMMPWHEETHRQVMRLLALDGQRSAALKQYELCQQQLQSELGVGVSPATEALYQRIKLHANFSLHNLPTATTFFVGREPELAQLDNWLHDPAVRLITITGAGGMGKTRLALAVGDRYLDASRTQPQAPFTDGIYFINLAPLDKPDQIVFAAVKALQFHVQSGNGRTPQQHLLDYLSTKKMLLILDNFEHLLAGVSFLRDILAQVPGIKLLATSRERLGLSGEHLLPLDGLTFADGNQTITEADLPAPQLFLATARRIRPELALSAKGHKHLNQLCRQVEGLPLALELAAQWVDALSIAQINAEISQNQSLLDSNAPDLPRRHRSMQAVFNSSWQRLSVGQQTVLASLSVFQGGFTFDAAQEVAGADLKTLALLVKRSLLRYDLAAERYTLHELLRQFASARLQMEPALEHDTHQRHLNYFRQVAKTGEKNLQGGDQIGWTKRLLQETDNIRLAITWGVAHDLETAVRLANRLYLFWFNTNQTVEAERLYKLFWPYKNQLPDDLHAWLLTSLAAISWNQGKFETIKTLSKEALPLFEKNKDNTGLALTYFHLSIIAGFAGDFETAHTHINTAIASARAVDNNTWVLTLCLQGKADNYLVTGAYDAAKRITEETIRLSAQREDRTTMIYGQGILARIAYNQGDYQVARQLSLQILADAQDLMDRRLEAFQYLTLGMIALAEDDPHTAVDYLATAVNIAENNLQWDVLNETYLSLADVYLATSEFDMAKDSLQRCAALCQHIEHSEYMATCLEKFALLFWQRTPGNLDTVYWLAAAAAWREEAGVPQTRADKAQIDPLLGTIQNQLTTDAFDRAWAQGGQEPLQEALSKATKKSITIGT